MEEEDEALIKSIFQVSTGISTFTSLLPMSSFLPPLHFSFPSWGVVVSNMVYFVKNLFLQSSRQDYVKRIRDEDLDEIGRAHV